MRTFRYFLLGICVILVSGCSNQGISTPTQPTPILTITPTLSPAPPEDDTGNGGISLPVLSDLATAIPSLPTRTPVPTATPDAVTKAVSLLFQKQGVSGQTLLWLKYADWVNLAISLLYVLAGYLIGTWLIRWLFPRLVRRTKTNLDDRLLKVSGNELRWLAVVMILQLAIQRLTFVATNLKTFIADMCFFIALVIVAVVLWRLIDLVAKEAERSAKKSGQQKEAESLITLSIWALRSGVLILVVTFLMGHYAVNITGFTLFLGIVILVFSFASRDLLSDIISGAMILVDRPYRIGDRLELPTINSWGDVVEIGMRSTKILSVENRMVVIPNSQIGKNQVVNYSYPDPSFFIFIDVRVAYENDPDQVAQIIEDAIHSVEGVQKDRDVLAYLIELNEFHMHYWACWWVANYKDRYPVQNRVSRAIVKALKEAGVVFPYQKGRYDIDIDSEKRGSNKERDSGKNQV